MVGNNCYNICMWALVCVLCRDQMGVVDVKVSSGQLDVSKEKNLLVWTLGRYCAPEHQCKRKKTHLLQLYTGKRNNAISRFPSLIRRTKVP